MSLYDDIITLDFEGEPIESRPVYPPRAVGLSIKEGNAPSEYLAFGHPTGNNTTEDDAVRRLARVWESGRPVLFHNASFDLSVCYERYGLPKLPWERVHDTMFLAFLCDPHGLKQDLKGLAEVWLDWPPEERDAVSDWVWEHRAELRKAYPGVSIARSRKNTANELRVTSIWRWFHAVPGDVLAPYAIGDTDRTKAIFDLFHPHTLSKLMGGAYDRERQVLDILMDNERDGLRVDVAQLEHDVVAYRSWFNYAEEALRLYLQWPGLNFDADQDVAEALTRAGVVDDDQWVLTPSGQKSVSKDNLQPSQFNDPRVASLLGYRNRLKTALTMFMEPWLEMAKATGGTIHTNWNQTRGEGGGTRTGRPSTSGGCGNLLNISKSFEGRPDGYVHPDFIPELPKLPLVRNYVLADDEQSVFLHRDFSGQELRIFGHFECGPLQRAYLAQPDLDVHQMVYEKILEIAPDTLLDRTKTKIINFRKIYGSGVTGLAGPKGLNCAYDLAKEFNRQHEMALPGRKALADEIERIVRRGDPIVTWGGRRYFPEEPRWDKERGRMMDFNYKLINYLIQGSAADFTKEALIRWHNHPERAARFLVTVYDEINISAHHSVAARQMQVLKECMESPHLDVPMLSDGKWGKTWGGAVKPPKDVPEEVALAQWIEENYRAAA